MTKEEAEKIVSKLTVDEMLILYVVLDILEKERNAKQEQESTQKEQSA